MSRENNFVIPSFVAEADPASFDVSDRRAFVVDGYRLDNPAAIWKAAAAMRDGAAMSGATKNLVKQACELFEITEDLFVRQASEPSVDVLTITDGKHTASFNVWDNESLNKAASDLINSRSSMSYAFAHDCAHTLKTIATYGNLKFDDATVVAIRKMAGDYPVDYATLRTEIQKRAARAKKASRHEEEAALNKLASQCSDSCPDSVVPIILKALEDYDQAYPELEKTATADSDTTLEFRVYISNAEALRKRAAEDVFIDSDNKISGAVLADLCRAGVLQKWAADNGYTVEASPSTEAVTSLLQSMPRVLRQEFMSIYC